MELAEALAQERRARLAAERLLAQKSRELSVANRRLSQHARALSVEIIEKREEVAEVQGDLAVARGRVEIAERRLWTSLTTIQDGFAVFDADDILVAANPAWLHPFDGVEAVGPGATYAEILQVAVEEGVVDIGDERPSAWTARMLTRWRQERVEPVVLRLWNGAFLRMIDRRGAGGDMVSLALNITGTMRNEARLKEARRKAEAASRAKSAFLANMSHELRTPMNGVVGMADLLADTPLDGEQKAFVETIRSSGEALLVIINDVLDFSKLDAGRMVLHLEEFDLEAVIHDVLQLLQPLAQGKGIALVVDYDMFLPSRFTGDRGRVRQVLTNLIGNAAKFTSQGSVTVRVTGIEEADGLHQVRVTVEDTGIGIPADRIATVFGEFTQIDDASNRRFEGTGLGLAISRRLVQLMGGEIWVESEEGSGSVFGFRLPLTAAAAAPPLPARLAGRTAVLVEPDAAAARALDGQLRALGLAVAHFPDAEAARAAPPADAAVLCAVETPGAPLADLAADLAGAGPPLPVLALGSAALPRPVRRDALAAALAALPEAPLAEPLGLRPMRVLAAEDNLTNQLVLSKMLRALDIELRFALNGRQAVEMAAAWPPDLIFMDISMPEMDGKEATRLIRAAETGRRVLIVALTAHALNGDETDILAAGLDLYLTKPLRKPVLIERILAATPADCRPPLPVPGEEAAAQVPRQHFLFRRRRAVAAG